MNRILQFGRCEGEKCPDQPHHVLEDVRDLGSHLARNEQLEIGSAYLTDS